MMKSAYIKPEEIDMPNSVVSGFGKTPDGPRNIRKKSPFVYLRIIPDSTISHLDFDAHLKLLDLDLHVILYLLVKVEQSQKNDLRQ